MFRANNHVNLRINRSLRRRFGIRLLLTAKTARLKRTRFAIVWRDCVSSDTPKFAIDKISNEVAAILAMPDSRDYLIKQASEAFISTPQQVNALLKAEVARYANIIKDANITVEH